MKIQIDRDTLLQPLQTVIGVISVKPSLPILSNVLVNIKPQKLTITGTDTEVELVGHAITPLPDTDVLLTLPGKKLADVLRTLPENAPIELYQQKERITLTSGKSRFTLSTLPAEDFPSFDKNSCQYSFDIPQNKLKNLLTQTQFAMAQQDVRYYLNGILLEFNPDHIKAVATDGHRLAYACIEFNTQVAARSQIIVPRKAATELIRLLQLTEDTVRLDIGTHFIDVTGSGFNFTSKLVEGRFPDYNRVIPKNNQTKILINREFMQNILHRVAIVSGESVRLAFKPNMLHAYAETKTENAEDDLIIEFSGEPFNIAFNTHYLLDAINNIQSEEIEMCLAGPDASALITEPGKLDVQYVVMPLRL
ncbi:MAG: DNA polymerase III subunit beta [Gammaproteobacteria bacterium RIFCSPHIGHO2_12_FULL_41_15]|nr:MAG: DNA polymerase III subunit beta [Gammaproteobacteria bacterium RIFCSPHIGHO2_12_FULL_41_15]